MSILRVCCNDRSLWWLLKNIEKASVWKESVIANLSLSETPRQLCGRREFSRHVKAALPSIQNISQVSFFGWHSSGKKSVSQVT